MSIYLLNIICIGSICILMEYNMRNRRKLIIIAFIYLFLVSSMRHYSIGNDYINYVNAFDIIKQYGTYYMESGYILLNKIISLFTDEYWGVAVGVNVLLMIPLCRYILQQVDNRYWWICILIFAMHPYMFLQSTFNIMRQACATGILLFGLNELLKKQNLKSIAVYTFFVLLSSCFHRSSYLMLSLVFILKMNWTATKWIVMIILSVLGKLFIEDIIQFYVSSVGNFRPEYANYNASLLNHPVYLFVLLVYIIYLIVNYNVITSLGNKKIFDLYLFSLCFLFLALSNVMMYRMYIMFAFCAIPGAAFLVSNFSKIRKKRNEGKILKALYICYYLAFYICYIGYLDYRQNAHYVPFRFFFE